MISRLFEMPEIKLSHIVSCSSEDKQFPSSNLVLSESFKKWKCSAGEKQAIAIIQFDRAVQIQSIDIGNCGSAFVEILAGHSASSDDDQFDLLLPTQSFMSPAESRSETNANRVRMFNAKDHFEKQAADKKYDRLKVICSQPYNKMAGYGLAFLRCHSCDVAGSNATESASTSNKKISSFFSKASLKVPDDADIDETKEKSSFAPGSMFQKRNKISDGAEAAQHQATAKRSNSPSPPEQTIVAKKSKHNDSKKHRDAPPSANKTRSKTTNNGQIDVGLAKRPVDPKHGSKPEKSVTVTKTVPFDRLFDGVVFVLSGFENPLRSRLRDKALAMGAKYSPDWLDGKCTHLVCAFADTPKFNQVRRQGAGRIVRKEWILESHKAKKRLNWKKFTFNEANNDLDKFPDDVELIADADRVTDDIKEKDHTEPSVSSHSNAKAERLTKEDEDVYNAPTDYSTSGVDTEDEIEQSLARQKIKQTDEETAQSMREEEFGSDWPALPDFFNNHVILMYGSDFKDQERKEIKRYVVAFGGQLVDYMDSKVTHVVTKSSWDKNFDQALDANAKLRFVKPQWILACGQKEKMVDIDEYLVTNSRKSR